jgi:hypothetical protein
MSFQSIKLNFIEIYLLLCVKRNVRKFSVIIKRAYSYGAQNVEL